MADQTDLEKRLDKLEERLIWLELPVGELESVVPATGALLTTVRVRLKGQRPDDECRLELTASTELLKVIHKAKERGGTVWIRFSVNNNNLTGGTLVVRDILE
jgi:hypothetical protein